ncbi:MAG: citronellyl-CoA synthetase [Bermanella sp.]|jgi:citronellyl-CoA synthetase
MSDQHIITTKKILTKLPSIIAVLPSLAKGLIISNTANTSKAVGLGLCIENCARNNPNGPAIMYEDRTLSYLEFNDWVNTISHYLLDKNIKKGDCVAILIENRPELLAAVAACAKIGAISAMINTSLKGKVLSHSINLVTPKLIIAGEECLQAYEEIRETSNISNNRHLYFSDNNTQLNPGITPSGWINLAKVITNKPTINPKTTDQIFSDDPCFYVYTSGTTGLPKAVIFNHGRFMRAYGVFGFASVRLKSKDRMYIPLPFYHSTAMVICWGSVLAGNSCAVMTRKFSASKFWSDIRKYKVTSFGYVGELCRYLIDQPSEPSDIDNRIRVIIGNGMRPSIWGDFKTRFGISRVMEFYASSEGNIGFSNILNFDHTVGFTPYPYAIVEYDKEHEQALKNNDGFLKKVQKGGVGLLIGEITLKAPFHGYTDSRKSKMCILHDVFKTGDAWFNTGDLMRDIGFRHAQFVDRTGDTYRWKGENVSTTEIEMLIDGVKNISETVVYGVEIPSTDGRAGMASIRLECAIDDFNFLQLLTYFKKYIPNYAIPLFLRISKEIDMTGTFKYKKFPLKSDGFCLKKIKEPIYVWLPKSDTYIPLTTEIHRQIELGMYRF